MLKFLSLCVALGVAFCVPMDLTTQRPEATTEDTSGRLLSLPVPEKCAQSKFFFYKFCFFFKFIIEHKNALLYNKSKIKALIFSCVCRLGYDYGFPRGLNLQNLISIYL